MSVEAAPTVVQLKVVLDAPVERVWETIATAQGLQRWFCTTASLSKPGEGGRLAIEWSVGDSFEVPITVWEPGKQLRLDHPPFQMDFFLKPRAGGRTELKLVNPTSAAFYAGTRSGWVLFLANLRHYLAGHVGEECLTREIPVPLHGSPADGWARLLGPRGVRLDAERLQIDVGAVSLIGRIDVCDPPYVFGGVLPHWGDTLFRVSFNYSGEPDLAHLVLLGYGDGAARLDELAALLEPWLADTLGSG
jgi:uncharacterized protein YndB with AHSA1/START domain